MIAEGQRKCKIRGYSRQPDIPEDLHWTRVHRGEKELESCPAGLGAQGGQTPQGGGVPLPVGMTVPTGRGGNTDPGFRVATELSHTLVYPDASCQDNTPCSGLKAPLGPGQAFVSQEG